MFSSEKIESTNYLGWADIYRPKSLKEVVGQERIIKEIVKKLNTKKLPANILLTGGSGTGKTTIGILIAQTINCKNPKVEVIDDLTYSSPCGECPSCKAIANNENNSGFHFFDGSDLNKEKVMGLKTLCNTPSLYGDKRIIFIDEMQNISAGKGSSLQGVLKLLEHDYKGQVHFIMSTMEPKKIHKSIVDRFHMHLKLKPVSSADLIERSQYILKSEGLLEGVDFSNIEQNTDFMSMFLKEGLSHLASSGTGSVREFIQNLETCVARELGTIKEIEEELELMSVDTSSDILMMLIAKDPKAFDSLSNIKGELESFINLSYNTLNDFYIYTKTNSARLNWQKGKYDIWKNKYYSNILQLIRVYNKIFESSVYYTNNYLMNKLITDYYESEERLSYPNVSTKVASDTMIVDVNLKPTVRTRTRHR